MGSLFDTIKAALSNPRKGTDSLAGPGSVAGVVKQRAAAPMGVADDIENGMDPNESMRRRLAQHSDHTGNSGRQIP